MTSVLHFLTRDSRWIPLLFVVFFLVVFAANGALVTIAVSSWTGLTTETYYRDGVEYNRRIAAAERQAELGWDVALTAEAQPGRRLDFGVSLAGPDGRPLYPQEVSVAFVRPTAEGNDSTHQLARRGEGRYGAVIELPLAGVWDAQVTVIAEGRRYQSSKRLFVKQ